jgi:hypothetical protein
MVFLGSYPGNGVPIESKKSAIFVSLGLPSHSRPHYTMPWRRLVNPIRWSCQSLQSNRTFLSESQMKAKLIVLAVVVFSSLAAKPLRAGIFIDTTQDGGFFSANPAALASLQAAANDINAAIDFSNLLAVSNDVTTGTAGTTVLNFDFSYEYSNPTTGAATTINNTVIPASQINIYAGARNLTGNTLGQGGPGGAGFSVSGVGGSGTLQAAANAAMANDQHRRGGGPIINQLAGSVGSANYAFNVGVAVGNLWFDNDTDDIGGTDTQATLNSNWHFDHTTAVAPGKSDFYSVALHEILHSIGLGTSDTWDSLVVGNNWLGANGIAAAGGSGVNLLSPGHLTDGIMSTRLSDGMLQKAVMVPSITLGSRKMLTTLDVAFLKDLGYNLKATAVPEPGSMLAISMLSLAAAYRARRRGRDSV